MTGTSMKTKTSSKAVAKRTSSGSRARPVKCRGASESQEPSKADILVSKLWLEAMAQVSRRNSTMPIQDAMQLYVEKVNESYVLEGLRKVVLPYADIHSTLCAPSFREKYAQNELIPFARMDLFCLDKV